MDASPAYSTLPPAPPPKKGMSGCVIAIIVIVLLGMLGMGACVVLGIYGMGKGVEMINQDMDVAAQSATALVQAIAAGKVDDALAQCRDPITREQLEALIKAQQPVLKGATGIDFASIEIPFVGKMRGEWNQHNNDTWVKFNPSQLVGASGQITVYLHRAPGAAAYRVYWVSIRTTAGEHFAGNPGLGPR